MTTATMPGSMPNHSSVSGGYTQGPGSMPTSFYSTVPLTNSASSASASPMISASAAPSTLTQASVSKDRKYNRRLFSDEANSILDPSYSLKNYSDEDEDCEDDDEGELEEEVTRSMASSRSSTPSSRQGTDKDSPFFGANSSAHFSNAASIPFSNSQPSKFISDLSGDTVFSSPMSGDPRDFQSFEPYQSGIGTELTNIQAAYDEYDGPERSLIDSHNHTIGASRGSRARGGKVTRGTRGVKGARGKTLRCMRRPCLRKRAAWGIHYWLGGGSISVFIISLLFIFFGITLSSVGKNPHPGQWVTTVCLSENATFYSPCREDFECSICRVEVVLEMKTSTQDKPQKISTTLSVRSTEEECMTIYSKDKNIVCRYPLEENIFLAALKVQTDVEFLDWKHLYQAQKHQGYVFLGLGAFGFLVALLNGFFKYCFNPLFVVFPCLRVFALRSICGGIVARCCSRSSEDREKIEQTAGRGIYLQLPGDGSIDGMGGSGAPDASIPAPVLGLGIPSDLSKIRQDKVYTDKTTGTKFKLEGIAVVSTSLIGPGPSSISHQSLLQYQNLPATSYSQAAPQTPKQSSGFVSIPSAASTAAPTTNPMPMGTSFAKSGIGATLPMGSSLSNAIAIPSSISNPSVLDSSSNRNLGPMSFQQGSFQTQPLPQSQVSSYRDRTSNIITAGAFNAERPSNSTGGLLYHNDTYETTGQRIGSFSQSQSNTLNMVSLSQSQQLAARQVPSTNTHGHFNTLETMSPKYKRFMDRQRAQNQSESSKPSD